MKHPRAALALLLPGMGLTYAWHWVPDELAGYAWNISASLLVVFLLAVIGIVFASVEVWAVCALLAMLKLMVVGCDVWYMVDPWPAKLGDDLCSARLNMPLGVVGLSLATLIGVTIYRGRK